MNLPSFLRNLAAAAIFTLAFTTAYAADVTARIRGTVTDPSGAVLPNVTLTATNAESGQTYTTVSQANGDYQFVRLPIGTYNVSASAPGFKAFAATGITLNIDQEYVEKVQLTVGSSSESVSVAANAVQVDSSNMQLSNVINSSQMVEYPLIGRNFAQLEQLLPGVQGGSDRFGTNGGTSVSANGSQSQQSSFLVDGADTNDLPLNGLTISPSVDAIDQFNLVTNSLNPEYSRNSGAIVTASIKSGTNSFHGSAFEFYRDSFLNTHNYFQQTAPKYHQNLFGGTLGGPILKDKLFFFGSYQGNRAIQPQTISNGTNTVYTAAELAGNFSGTTFSDNVIPATIAVPGCVAGVTTFADCFASGNIPTSAFNSIATSLVSKYVPLPNSGTNKYVFNPTTSSVQDQAIVKVDFSPTSRDQISFTGLYNHGPSSDTLPFTGGTLPGFGDINTAEIRQLTANYSRQLSATALNNFAVHYTRFNYGAVSPQNIVQPSTLGFDITSQNPSVASVPNIAVGSNFTLGFSNNGPQPRIDQTYQADDNFSKVLGHHSLKFGWDGRRFNVDNPFYSNNNGTYSFTDSNLYGSGSALVDFLLGIPDSYSQSAGGRIDARAYENYFYAQDSWKATNSLTLTYGIGYQIDTPLHNRQFGGEGVTCFIPGQQSTVFPSAPVGLNFPSDHGCNDASSATTFYKNVGPRIGFAYAPDLGRLSGGSEKKLSIRGGFGIYYNRTEEETSLNNLGDPPFGLSSSGAVDYANGTNGVVRPGFANPYQSLTTGATFTNKFPASFPTAGTSPDFSPFEPFELSQYSPNFRSPYAENFNLTIERELPSNIVTRISYVGSLGRRNQIYNEALATTQAGHDACLADPACIANQDDQTHLYPSHVLNGVVNPADGTNFFKSNGLVTTEGASSYNSLQLSATKGTTHGLLFQASYTYGHALDNASNYENSGYGGTVRGYNQYQPSLNYGDSAYDARHRFVFSPVYSIPFRTQGNAHALTNLALSGWEISGILTLATGFPYDISYGGGVSYSLWCSAADSFYACPDIPNQVAPLSRINPRAGIGSGSASWFDPSSFVDEVTGSFGNIHRNPYHGPGINNTNVQISKNFPYMHDERHTIQLRLESYNVFNHTQFANPDGNFSDANFGQITSAAAGRQTQLAGKIYF
jgi:hypothetical protein